MNGARLTPHTVHALAVLVRVVAAVTFVAGPLVVLATAAALAENHLSASAALVRIGLAVACTAAAILTTRRLDPLRG